MAPIGIYLHFPFCTHKCAYCHFYSSPRFLKLMPDYVSALCREIDLSPHASGQLKVGSVYCGGGTPSLVEPALLGKVLETVNRRFTLLKDAEITLEINPASTTPTRLKTYRALGINRLSFGVQSLDNRLLKLIGRPYPAARILSLIEQASALGFANLSADLIFSLPTQTLSEWFATLSGILSLPLTHLACYSLEIHPDTAIGHWYRSGIYQPLSDPDDRRMYRLADEVITAQGFHLYEISNWAKPGFECHHHLSLWQGGEYLGFGASAESYILGSSFTSQANIEAYLENYTSTHPVLPKPDKLTPDQLIQRFLLLQSRLIGGIDMSQFYRRFRLDFAAVYQTKLQELQSGGFIKLTPTTLTFTPKGRDRLDSLLAYILK